MDLLEEGFNTKITCYDCYVGFTPAFTTRNAWASTDFGLTAFALTGVTISWRWHQ